MYTKSIVKINSKNKKIFNDIDRFIFLNKTITKVHLAPSQWALIYGALDSEDKEKYKEGIPYKGKTLLRIKG